MKKLFIMLIACCSVAIADPTLDSVANNDNQANTSTSQSHDNKVIMVKGTATSSGNNYKPAQRAKKHSAHAPASKKITHHSVKKSKPKKSKHSSIKHKTKKQSQSNSAK
jgi:hypothetical protein